MRLVRDPKEMQPCVLALGMFDGVHVGHQALLNRGRELADAMGLPLTVCAFEPHPMQVLLPERAPARLTTEVERIRWMAWYQVDELSIHTFTKELANQDPECFLQMLEALYHPAAAVFGFNFTYGREGKGDEALVRKYARDRGFLAEMIPAVTIGGETVSSTRIRRLLEAGEIGSATRLLGHPWTLTGRVENGKHIGRTLGFPTANIRAPRGKALPASGVYICWADSDGVFGPAVVNVGIHPTLPEGPATVEAHLLRGHPDLYGKPLRLTFLKYMRPEQTFPDAGALRRQIGRDRTEALRWLSRAGVPLPAPEAGAPDESGRKR